MKINLIENEESPKNNIRLLKSKKNGRVLLMLDKYTAISILEPTKPGPWPATSPGTIVRVFGQSNFDKENSSIGLGYSTFASFERDFTEIHGTISIEV